MTNSKTRFLARVCDGRRLAVLLVALSLVARATHALAQADLAGLGPLLVERLGDGPHGRLGRGRLVLAGAEAAMNKYFKEKRLEGDLLVRMTLNVRVGITAECKPGDHDAVLKVLDEVATLTKSKDVLADIAELRERVVKVRDMDAERKKAQGK